MEMSFEDAERYKDKFERRKLLPSLKKTTVQRRCHYHGCSNITELRCKACRAPYCSRDCQSSTGIAVYLCVSCRADRTSQIHSFYCYNAERKRKMVAPR